MSTLFVTKINLALLTHCMGLNTSLGLLYFPHFHLNRLCIRWRLFRLQSRRPGRRARCWVGSVVGNIWKKPDGHAALGQRWTALLACCWLTTSLLYGLCWVEPACPSTTSRFMCNKKGENQDYLKMTHRIREQGVISLRLQRPLHGPSSTRLDSQR